MHNALCYAGLRVRCAGAGRYASRAEPARRRQHGREKQRNTCNTAPLFQQQPRFGCRLTAISTFAHFRANIFHRLHCRHSKQIVIKNTMLTINLYQIKVVN